MSQVFESARESARRLLGGEPARPKTWCEEVEENVCSVFPALSWHQRLIGCLCCFLLGFILQFGSFFRFTKLLVGDPEPFVFMYTIGNLISIGSSCFLSGPWSQVKSMFAPTRAIATSVYMITLIITLIVCFTDIPGQGATLVLCIIIQFLSGVYYILSYIPFARQILWQMMGISGEASGSLV